MVPFYGWCSTDSRLEPLQGGTLLLITKFPEISGTHFIDIGKIKAVSRPWSRPVVLNSGSLDWEFSTLTTRPLLHYSFEGLLLKVIQGELFAMKSFSISY